MKVPLQEGNWNSTSTLPGGETNAPKKKSCKVRGPSAGGAQGSRVQRGERGCTAHGGAQEANLPRGDHGKKGARRGVGNANERWEKSEGIKKRERNKKCGASTRKTNK